jgi:hypothetical protein
VIYAPVYGGGGGYYTGNQKRPVATQSVASTPATKVAAIPVNPAHPAPVGMVVSSPFAHSMASSQTLQAHSSSGFRTASGVTVPVGRAAASNGGQAGPAVSGRGFSGVSGNGVSVGHASTGISGASAGGHSSGAASGGGAHR